MTEVTFCTKRLYNNPEAGIHVPCWNYLYECSGITGGGIVPPNIFHQEILWSTKKKGTRKGNGEEKKENLKGKKWKIENRRGKVWKWAEDLLFYLFIYFACHFLKPLKFVWGLPEWTILPGKIIFHAGTKSGTWICFLWKILLLRHCTDFQIQLQMITMMCDTPSPCPLIWKPPCLSKFEKHCIVRYLCWISALFFIFE